jgi:DNA-binding transcriptional MerR regulator
MEADYMKKPIVFELSQVAGIVGISIDSAKNWVNGRTLQIEPSISKARGKGTRNLFSEGDVYMFFFVDEVARAGFRNEIIRELLPLVEAELEKAESFPPWLIVRRTYGEWRIELREGRSPLLTLPLEHEEFAFCLNLRDVSRKIQETNEKAKKSPNGKAGGKE